jgi:hypothetical protein
MLVRPGERRRRREEHTAPDVGHTRMLLTIQQGAFERARTHSRNRERKTATRRNKRNSSDKSSEQSEVWTPESSSVQVSDDHSVDDLVHRCGLGEVSKVRKAAFILIAHVHSTVEHHCASTQGHHHAAPTNILSGTYARKQTHAIIREPAHTHTHPHTHPHTCTRTNAQRDLPRGTTRMLEAEEEEVLVVAIGRLSFSPTSCIALVACSRTPEAVCRVVSKVYPNLRIRLYLEYDLDNALAFSPLPTHTHTHTHTRTHTYTHKGTRIDEASDPQHAGEQRARREGRLSAGADRHKDKHRGERTQSGLPHLHAAETQLSGSPQGCCLGSCS